MPRDANESCYQEITRDIDINSLLSSPNLYTLTSKKNHTNKVNSPNNILAGRRC